MKKKFSKLTFHFKNGDKVTIDKVVKWSVGDGGGNNITSIAIAQDDPQNRMIVKSLDLKAINCITESEYEITY